MSVIRRKVPWGTHIEVSGLFRMPSKRLTQPPTPPRVWDKRCARCGKTRIPNRNKYCGTCRDLHAKEYEAEYRQEKRAAAGMGGLPYSRRTLGSLKGKIFGRLTVVGRGCPPTTKDTHKYWLCQCTCGGSLSVRSNNLIGGRTRHCGCERAGYAAPKTAARNRAAFAALRRVKDLEEIVDSLTRERDELKKRLNATSQ
jgi:hypothetical protein